MTASAKIPFVDLITPHLELEAELVEVFRSAIRTASFIGGPAVDGFEREFAAFCGARHAIGLSTGTDALLYALIAAGVKAGDLVITVPLTFIATCEAISHAGAVPAFVDVDERTYTMDPVKLREYLETQCALDAKTGKYVHRKLGKPVTAVIPVHLYGQTADMDPIIELAQKYNLALIEDACQAHGAEYFSKKENRWRKAGSMGIAAAFSFYPGKNLGACGEGGAVTTDDAGLATQIARLRDHGQVKKYYHDVVGYNGRLDAIQAGILRVKLQHLARWNEERRVCAARYNDLLKPLAGSIATPYQPSWSKPVYHLYVIRTAARDDLQKHLNEQGIGTGIHYPIPVHLQTAYASQGWKRGEFPVSEAAADQILSLPMFGGLASSQQEVVAETVAKAVTSYTTT